MRIIKLNSRFMRKKKYRFSSYQLITSICTTEKSRKFRMDRELSWKNRLKIRAQRD